MKLTTLAGEVLFFYHSSWYNHPPSPFFSLFKTSVLSEMVSNCVAKHHWWSEACLNFGGVGHHFWVAAPPHIMCDRRML